MARLRKNNKTVKREERNITKKVGKKQHQYYTRMNYDGRILSVESKQDNTPIRRKKYTLKQLRREIPVAAELIEQYLGGKVPQSLHNHSHAVSIYPVLPNPVDLGLLPPGAMTATTATMPASSRHAHIGDEFRPISMTSDCSPSTCERSHGRKHHVAAYDNNDVINNDVINNDYIDNNDEIMKLFVSEKDDRDDRGHDRRIRIR
jgi:hypothetical protein